MPDVSISIMGNPLLMEKSIAIKQFNESLYLLVQDLKDTMLKNHGVGISAPQIGNNQRVIVFGFKKNKRYPNENPVPLTTLINPEYKVLSENMVSGWEGCLSVPGMRGLVPRFEKIKYRGYDEDANLIERVVSGFHARLVQHEVDHLNGILFPSKIQNLKNFGFEKSLPFY
jgi:peptide deformylase